MNDLAQYGKKWSHDETVLALGLYFQLPFARVNKFHPEVVKLSKLMHRSPASLSMKIGNIGRLDPTLTAQGITGLTNGANTEKEIWDEFYGRRDELATEYHRLRLLLEGHGLEEADDVIKTPPGLDREHLSRYRVNQSFFRNSVLTAYNNTCCITGISEPKLLVASHIRPWAKCESGNDRTDTCNGLCLNALHDRAFDKGLFTLDSDFRIVLSKALRDAMTREVYAEYFARYEGNIIRLPDRGLPSRSFLEYHWKCVFVDSL